MSLDLSAYAELTAHRDTAIDTFLCDWVANDHLGGHDWCPTVLEPGDTYTLVVMAERIVGRYCLGCGYHLFGTPRTRTRTPPHRLTRNRQHPLESTRPDPTRPDPSGRRPTP